MSNKELSRLHSASSNRISSTLPSGIPASVKDVNSYSRQSYQMHDRSSINNMQSLNDMVTSHDANELASVGSLMDATNAQADDIFGVSDLDIKKAIEDIEGCVPLNYQVMAQETVDPIKEKNSVGMHQRSLVLNQAAMSLFEDTDLLPKWSHKGTQMPSPEHDADMPRYIHRQNSKKIQTHRSQSYGKTKEAILADQETCHSRNKSLNSGRSVAKDQRSTGRALTRTIPGPALLRTASMAHPDRPCSSSQRSSWRSRELTQRNESHQIINMPTLLEEKRHRKNVAPKYDQRRSSTKGSSKKAHRYPSDRHWTSKQRTKARVSPISSSASSSSGSYSSLETGNTSSSSDTSSSYSVPRSTKPSRRTDHSPPRHQKVPTTHTKNTEKKTGKLQRIKNKLGLIFHHHHHHHHHHHDGAKSEVALTALRSHNPSVWKKFGKMLHRTKKDGTRTCQREAEHGIIDGLIRHIRRSKKGKKPVHSNNKKKVKKWHWWQQFRKRRGVVRQPTTIRKQGGAGLGFKAKKQPPLRALTLK